MTTETALRLTGIDCEGCAQRLASTLKRLDGVIKVEVDRVGTAKVRYDETRLSEEDLAERVRGSGFDMA